MVTLRPSRVVPQDHYQLEERGRGQPQLHTTPVAQAAAAAGPVPPPAVRRQSPSPARQPAAEPLNAALNRRWMYDDSKTCAITIALNAAIWATKDLQPHSAFWVLASSVAAAIVLLVAAVAPRQYARPCVRLPLVVALRAVLLLLMPHGLDALRMMCASLSSPQDTAAAGAAVAAATMPAPSAGAGSPLLDAGAAACASGAAGSSLEQCIRDNNNSGDGGSSLAGWLDGSAAAGAAAAIATALGSLYSLAQAARGVALLAIPVGYLHLCMAMSNGLPLPPLLHLALQAACIGRLCLNSQPACELYLLENPGNRRIVAGAYAVLEQIATLLLCALGTREPIVAAGLAANDTQKCTAVVWSLEASIGFMLATLVCWQAQLQLARQFARDRGGPEAEQELRRSQFERVCAPVLEAADQLGWWLPMMLAAVAGFSAALLSWQWQWQEAAAPMVVVPV